MMKRHLEQRNEELRRDYQKSLKLLSWRDAVKVVAKKYNLTYSTASAIIFHQGYYKIQNKNATAALQ